jgi:hypothetical protein
MKRSLVRPGGGTCAYQRTRSSPPLCKDECETGDVEMRCDKRPGWDRKHSSHQLDELFRTSPSGAAPAGVREGIAILFPLCVQWRWSAEVTSGEQTALDSALNIVVTALGLLVLGARPAHLDQYPRLNGLHDDATCWWRRTSTAVEVLPSSPSPCADANATCQLRTRAGWCLLLLTRCVRTPPPGKAARVSALRARVVHSIAYDPGES